MRLKNIVLIWLMLSTIMVVPIIGYAIPQNTDDTIISISAVEELEGVPYVWQELNGYCAWAATSILFQHAGVDLDLGGVFAASSVGYSFAYIRQNDTLLMFPGVMYQQVEPTAFAADLYDLNFTLYLSDDVEGSSDAIEYWERMGISVGVIEDQVDSMDLLRNTIDSGYPLLASVNPSWIPLSDYDDFRDEELSGGGHAIVIVGYNDTAQSVTYIDPGVGSFGDDYGYPEDGRGNYTTMSYATLNFAWSERYYISYVIKPNEEPTTTTSNVAENLGPLIRDKLLGVGTTYSPNSASAFLWHFGEDAFRKLSEDITIEGLKDYLSVFDGSSNEVELKAGLLALIGIGLEVQCTLQGYSYLTATRILPSLMPDLNLTGFIDAADNAYPHFDAISDNSSLIYSNNISKLSGFVATTFLNIAESFNSTEDLDTSLSMYSDNLTEISQHLLGIADAWREAGNELDKIWPAGVWATSGTWIVIAIVVIGIFAAITVLVIKRTPSR